VDVVAYELDAMPIAEALVEVTQRGVPVRLVTDSDNIDEAAIDLLESADIPVVEDGRSAIMHDKFIIIDGRILWVGAMNFTTNDVYCNNNNTVRFDSAELAANYTAEINEMFVDGGFGPRSADATPNRRLTIDGIAIENYFAAEEEVAPILADEIGAAESEILFMAFSFTHEDIGEAILAKAEAGLTVRGVFETTGSETRFSYFGPLSDAGLANLQVRQDGNPRVMHHKVIIVDRETVVFGSFNFSGAANDDNDENVLVVHDPTFTGYFVEEFERVWGEAQQ
jgi:phosphatidylserine/phosphatidylglycerophosphate/cardiolipin synthase-like enzyme